jgi:hypothetical protein
VYYLFSVYILLFSTALPGIYLRRNISVANGKQISGTINKMCADYFSGLLEKEGEEREKICIAPCRYIT